MSDEEDFEDSDEGDFSVSEDEWKPDKNEVSLSSSSSDEDDTFQDISASSSSPAKSVEKK